MINSAAKKKSNTLVRSGPEKKGNQKLKSLKDKGGSGIRYLGLKKHEPEFLRNQKRGDPIQKERLRTRENGCGLVPCASGDGKYWPCRWKRKDMSWKSHSTEVNGKMGTSERSNNGEEARKGWKQFVERNLNNFVTTMGKNEKIVKGGPKGRQRAQKC